MDRHGGAGTRRLGFAAGGLTLAVLAAGCGVGTATPPGAAPVVHLVSKRSSAAAEAEAEARLAEAASRQAAQDAGQVERTAEVVLALAKPETARIPSAANPATAWRPGAAALAALNQAVSAAAQAAAMAQRHASAGGTAGEAAATAAGTALASARAVAAEANLVASSVASALHTWTAIHNAPSGWLGVVGENPPPGSGVSGCEILTVEPGSPAAAGGLVGATQRLDPVGDTIDGLVDQTSGMQWQIGSCAALEQAMAETRGGDVLTVEYQHREVVWYLLSGRWVPKTTTVQLIPSTCPPPLTGTVTATRIFVTIRVNGPTGSATMPAIIDTGGAQGWMDAGLLNRLGYSPLPGSRFDAAGYLGAPPGTVGYLYRIAYPDILDHGRFVPLGHGTVLVEGIEGLSRWNPDAGLGPDQLQQASFALNGTAWTLSWPGCGW